MKTLALVALALMLFPPAVYADSTVIRDRDGRQIYTKDRDGRDTHYRDRDGRNTITERDNGHGSRDYYNIDGEYIGEEDED
jgi:hypothetical protein